MRRTAGLLLLRQSRLVRDILHKETSFQLLKRSTAAMASRGVASSSSGGSTSSSSPSLASTSAAAATQQRLVANVAFDNCLRTLTIFGEHSSSCSVPFEWILDHDTGNLDKNGQRICIINPELVNAYDIESVNARPTSAGDLRLEVNWKLQRAGPAMPKWDISYAPQVPLRSSVTVTSSVLHSGQCTVGSAAFLPSYQSSSLHFYSRIHTHREAWTSRQLLDGKPPRGTTDPPICTVVPHVNTQDLNNKHELLQTIERFGFAVVVDPSLSRRSGKTTEEVVQKRKDAAESIIINTFNVLRNSHYGLMSSWSTSDEWKKVKLCNDGEGGSLKKAKSKSSGAAKPTVAPDGDASHQDGAYAASLLDLHTDGTYFVECPKLQAFGCIFHDPHLTIGGETTIADGFAVAGELAEKHPNLFRLLCTVPVGGRYEKEGKMYESYRPVITLRPTTSCITRSNVADHVERISFNNSDRCPMMLGTPSSIWSAPELRMFYQAYYKFHELVHSPDFALKFLLRPGQLLFFDNHRVLHGRLQFRGPRVMCGAYVGTDEYYSSLKAEESKF